MAARGNNAKKKAKRRRHASARKASELAGMNHVDFLISVSRQGVAVTDLEEDAATDEREGEPTGRARVQSRRSGGGVAGPWPVWRCVMGGWVPRAAAVVR